MKKLFCLDTNVFIYDPMAIYSFEDNDIIVPLAVLEELDGLKNRKYDDAGKNARSANRILDDLRQKGDLTKGIILPGGGTLRIIKSDYNAINMPAELDKDKTDNLVLSMMLDLQKSDPSVPLRLITKDISMRIKCDMLGVPCDDYLKHRVAGKTELIYGGVRVIHVKQEQLDEFHTTKRLSIDALDLDEPMLPNEYAVIKNGSAQSGSGLAKMIDNELRPIIKCDDIWGIKPRNKEQKFALDSLLDDNVKLTTLIGRAGCVVPETLVEVRLADVVIDAKPVPADTYHDAPNDWET